MALDYLRISDAMAEEGIAETTQYIQHLTNLAAHMMVTANQLRSVQVRACHSRGAVQSKLIHARQRQPSFFLWRSNWQSGERRQPHCEGELSAFSRTVRRR